MSAALSQVASGVSGAFASNSRQQLEGQLKQQFPGFFPQEEQKPPGYKERQAMLEQALVMNQAIFEPLTFGLPTDQEIAQKAQDRAAEIPSASMVSFRQGRSVSERRAALQQEQFFFRANIGAFIQSGQLTAEQASEQLMFYHFADKRLETEGDGQAAQRKAFYNSTKGGSVQAVKMRSGNSVSFDLGLNDSE